jgi:hypothetical protein
MPGVIYEPGIDAAFRPSQDVFRDNAADPMDGSMGDPP